jgi:hypothetical protein
MLITRLEAKNHKKLKGTENLAELVSIYTIEKALYKSDSLPKLNAQFKEDERKDSKDLQKILKNILSEVCTAYEKRKLEDYINLLIGDHICTKYGSKYDELLPGLFELERRIPYDNMGEKIEIKIPLFASADLDGDRDWEYKIPPSQITKHRSINIVSERPLIPKKIREKARIAIADYYQIFADVVREPVIGDLITNNIKEYKQDENLNMKIFWIPKPSELKINIAPDRDPILVAKINDIPYLIARWNIEHEEPIEHYVSEFSVGKLKRI